MNYKKVGVVNGSGMYYNKELIGRSEYDVYDIIHIVETYLIMKQMNCFSLDTIEKRNIIQNITHFIQIRGLICKPFLNLTPGFLDKCSNRFEEERFRNFANTQSFTPDVLEFMKLIDMAIRSRPKGYIAGDWLTLLRLIHMVKDKAMPGEQIGLGNVRSLIGSSLRPDVTAEHIDLAWIHLRDLSLLTCDSDRLTWVTGDTVEFIGHNHVK